MKAWFENKNDKYRTRKRKPEMVSQKTKNLFWLNVKSRAYQFVGGFLIISSLITFFFNWFLAIVLIVVSIFLLIKGNQQMLEYKIRSGHILYNG